MGPGQPLDTPLVGREAEMARVSEVLARVRRGESVTLLVTGSAGIGKTALVDRSLAGAEADGTVVLRGTGLPLTSLASPFRTVRGMLRDAPAGLVAEGLGRRLAGTSGVVDPVELDARLDDVATERPVLLAVDDIHWVDVESLDVLRYVIAGRRARAVGVVLTLRTEELVDGHPLHRWLADVRRLPGFEQLDLTPLDRYATEQQVTALLGALPDVNLVDEVFERSQGIPYLTRLLSVDLDPSSSHLPDSAPPGLEDAVLAAWHGLSPGARALTTVLAIAGQALTRADLADLVMERMDDARVPEWTAEALDRGVLGVDRQGRYWFHHPLQAELLEERADPDDRRSWHESCADLLRARLVHRADPARDPARVVAVADHYEAAGMRDEAVEWSLRVASGVGGQVGAEDVARALRRAIILGGGEGTGDGGRTTEELLHRLRDATARSGDLEGELDAVDRLLELVDREDRPAEAAELLVRRIHLLFLLRRHDDRVEDAEEAVAVAAGAGRTWQHALALAQLAFALAWALDRPGSGERAAEVAREAVAAAETAGHPRALSHALAALTMASIVTGHMDTATATAGRAWTEAARSGDFYAMYQASSMEVNTCGGSHARALAIIERRRDYMAAQGAPYTWLACMSQRVARQAVECGRVETARQAIRFALGADPGPTGYIGARLSACRLALLTGSDDEAAQHYARVEEIHTEGDEFRFWGEEAIRAELLLASGEPRTAVDVALDALRRHGNRFRAEWLLPLAARGLADLAELQRSGGLERPTAAEEASALGLEYPPASDDGTVPSPIPSTEPSPDADYRLRLRGFDAWYCAELARAGRADDAPLRWSRAASALDLAPDLPWEAAYAWMRLGEAHLQADRPDRRAAARSLRGAVERATPLDAGPVLERATALARRASLDLDDALASTGDERLWSLTPRELEVLDHVVDGRTYAEIGQALFIAEKTVSSHISNILRKTGVANRYELAELVREAQSRTG